LAFSKKHKTVMTAQYEQLLRESQAVFILEFSKMSMKDIDALRAKVREAGGRAHVVKNTLMMRALTNVGLQHPEELTGTSLAGFALSDVPALAKVFSDAAKSDFYKIKSGFMDGRQISAEEIKMLADLPPLPVVRAQLLGVLLATATKLVRTLAEPSRQVASVIKAYSEKEAVPA